MDVLGIETDGLPSFQLETITDFPSLALALSAFISQVNSVPALKALLSIVQARCKRLSSPDWASAILPQMGVHRSGATPQQDAVNAHDPQNSDAVNALFHFSRLVRILGRKNAKQSWKLKNSSVFFALFRFLRLVRILRRKNAKQSWKLKNSSVFLRFFDFGDSLGFWGEKTPNKVGS